MNEEKHIGKVCDPILRDEYKYQRDVVDFLNQYKHVEGKYYMEEFFKWRKSSPHNWGTNERA